ncbi:MAG: hypothetical protein ACR2QU_12185 [Gammaproteobacteria bacterium]
MNTTGRHRFTAGLSAGVLATLLVALLATLVGHDIATGQSSSDVIGATIDWVWRNLGFSVPVFGLVLVLYVTSLDRLRQALVSSAPLEDVAQADHLSDVWTSLFFGVGVIWTAIGMRGALVQALAGPVDTALGGGVEVLERMVDGGILLALSTTIFGGVGGYLMRAWKALVVGAALKRFYEREARRDLAAMRVSLSAIERRLNSFGPDEAGRR